VEVGGIAFSDLTNTRSIEAATFTAIYFDELTAPSNHALAAGVGDSETEIDLAAAGPAQPGDVIQVDREVMRVEDVANGGTRYVVMRGSHGSAAAAHTVGTTVFHLRRKTIIIPFPREFFGSPASGSFTYSVSLPDARIAAAEMFVTNSKGNSETRRKAFTASIDKGLRTLSGGQISIQVEGPLAIQSGAAPPLVIEDPHAVRDVFATVNDAPTGAPVELRLRVNGASYCTVTIPSGATVSNVVDGFGLPALQALAALTLDIESVPQGGTMSPGRDLTVTIRL
jgi:hypothetical protein